MPKMFTYGQKQHCIKLAQRVYDSADERGANRQGTNALKGKFLDLAATDRHKAFLREFYMDVAEWRKLHVAFPMNWNRLLFTSANKIHIPKERGIYIFALSLEPSPLPQHGYIMYMGIAGANSNGTLFARYKSYLRDLAKGDGRRKVYDMLKRWDGHLFFNFACIPDLSVDLKKLETAYLDAIRPPVNTADFTAEVANAKAPAW